MRKIITAHTSSKYQVTIPKEARQVLGIKDSSEQIGFVIESETRTVKLTRVNIVEAEEELTDDECRKLLHLADKPSCKSCRAADEAIKFHKKLTK